MVMGRGVMVRLGLRRRLLRAVVRGSIRVLRGRWLGESESWALEELLWRRLWEVCWCCEGISGLWMGCKGYQSDMDKEQQITLAISIPHSTPHTPTLQYINSLISNNPASNALLAPTLLSLFSPISLSSYVISSNA